VNCDVCKAGTVAPKPNMTNCLSCPKGEYQQSPGQLACDTCPYPQTTYGEGADKESECEGPRLKLYKGADFSGDSTILIDRKTGRPTGFKSVKSVEVIDGNWRLYSLIGEGGTEVYVVKGQKFTVGDGQKDTEFVLSAASYSVTMPNVYCYLPGYSEEYQGYRAMDSAGTACDEGAVCRSSNSSLAPSCKVNGVDSDCGVPQCIWDNACFTASGEHYRGTTNRVEEKWLIKFNCTCQYWVSDHPTKQPFHPSPENKKYGIGDHDFCRNPDPSLFDKPMCYLGNTSAKCKAFIAAYYARDNCNSIKKCSTEKYYSQ